MELFKSLFPSRSLLDFSPFPSLHPSSSRFTRQESPGRRFAFRVLRVARSLSRAFRHPKGVCTLSILRAFVEFYLTSFKLAAFEISRLVKAPAFVNQTRVNYLKFLICPKHDDLKHDDICPSATFLENLARGARALIRSRLHKRKR